MIGIYDKTASYSRTIESIMVCTGTLRSADKAIPVDEKSRAAD